MVKDGLVLPSLLIEIVILEILIADQKKIFWLENFTSTLLSINQFGGMVKNGWMQQEQMYKERG